MPKMASY